MSRLAETFNRSGFSQFVNSTAGRIIRLAAGIAFLIVGCIYSTYVLGVIAIVLSVFPLAAGAFNLCYISALLGGPISGNKIRKMREAG